MGDFGLDDFKYEYNKTLYWTIIIFSIFCLLMYLLSFFPQSPEPERVYYDNGGTCDYGLPCPESSYEGDTSVDPDSSSIEGYGWQMGY